MTKISALDHRPSEAEEAVVLSDLRSLVADARQQAFVQLKDLSACCKSGMTWREYEADDARLHREIAVPAHNAVLLALVDLLTEVRRIVKWGRQRQKGDKPPESHHSFTDHDLIIDAIAHREPIKTSNAMRYHLQKVEDRLVGRI